MAIKRRRFDAVDFDGYFEWLRREFEGWGVGLMERPSWNLKASTIEPLRDVVVTPTEVVVTVDLPFTKENTLKVKAVDDDTLEISARMRRKVSFKEMGVTHHLGEFRSFHLYSRVPVPVRMDKMKMRFKKGMLEVHLPRKGGRLEKRT